MTSGESISGRLGQTLYVRQKEEKNYQPSPFTAVTLPTRPAAPSAVAVDESIDAKADGKIIQVDSTMQYSSDGTSWQTVSGTQITSLADGSYYLRRAATDTSLAGEIQTVVIRPGRKLVVTFKAEGSSDITRKVSYGETLLDIPAVPVREGYTQITPMWDVSEFRDLKDDLTVHAIYTINTYPITLFPGEGYTLSAVGSSASPVDHGGSFTFRFSLNQGYDKSDTFAVSVNGTPITLAADGSYTISDIKSATSVSVQRVADITPPTGVLSLGEESWRQLLPAPTWTRYFASAPLITVSGDDNGSGLKEISYYASAEALNSDQLAALPDQSWQSVGAPFSLPAKHGERWIVYAKLTDQWDNAAYLCSEGFTYDLGAPVIDAAPGQTYYGDQRIAINDPNLDQVTLNGEEAVLEEGALFIPAEKKSSLHPNSNRQGRQPKLVRFSRGANYPADHPLPAGS